MSTGEQGITPACAGKSLRCHLRSAVRWDHPRVCGEKWEEELSSRLEEGSPPRVRGKGEDRKIALLRYGITPACAGKRTGAEACGGCSWDHPRVCGEKFIHSSLRYGRLGSPPRVRGKDYDSARIRCQLGITPACAGKRLKRSHSIGHFSYILCLFHSVLHRASVSGGSRAGPCAPPCLPAQNAVPV